MSSVPTSPGPALTGQGMVGKIHSKPLPLPLVEGDNLSLSLRTLAVFDWVGVLSLFLEHLPGDTFMD